MKLQTVFKRREFKVFCLLGIIFFGLFLRIYKIDSSIPYIGDNSRDIFVARHYTLFNEWNIFARGVATAGLNTVQYSSFPYLFISLLYTFVNTPIGYFYLFALLSAVAIPLGYLIGKAVDGVWFGLFFSFLVAVNNAFITGARRMNFPDYLYPFVFCALFVYLNAAKRRSAGLYVMSWFLAFLAVEMHLSAIPLFIGLVASSLFLCIKNKDYRAFIILLLVAEILAMVLVVLHVDFHTQNTQITGTVTALTFFKQISVMFTRLLENMFPRFTDVFVSLKYVAMLFITLKLIRKFSSDPFILLFIGFFAYGLLPSGISHGYYVNAYIPILLLFISRYAWNIRNIIIRIVCLLGIVYLTFLNIGVYNFSLGTGDYYDSVALAHAIMDNEDRLHPGWENKAPPVFDIYYSDTGTYFDFFTHAFWYEIERQKGIKLLSLKKYDNNLLPLDETSTGYLICDTKNFPKNKDCVAQFIRGDEVVGAPIYSLTTGTGKRYDVYRFSYD